MTRYDPDRIAALAAGSLNPAEAAALEAEIAADPRAAAELAAQRLALRAIRQSPAPVLSAVERTELRRAVAAALNLEEAPVAAVPARRRVPWGPLAVAAAALAAIVAVVPLIGLLSIGGDDEAAMTTVALVATTVTPYGDYEAAENDGAPWASTLSGEGEQSDLNSMGLTSVEGAAKATEALDRLIADPALLFDTALRHLPACAEAARVFLGEEAQPSGITVPLAGGEAVVWFVSSDGTTVERLVILDPAGCILLAAHP